MTQPVPEPLAAVLSRFFHVDTMRANWVNLISGYIDDGLHPDWPALFRRQLAEAIQGGMTQAQYHALTGDDVESPTELKDNLMQIWAALYGAVPVTSI